MEPNTKYRPPFGLGQKFVNAQKEVYEIIATHWGIPGIEDKRLPVVVELTTGQRINLYAQPDQSELKKIGIKRMDKPDAKVVTKTVEEMQKAEEARIIKFI